MLAVEAIKNQEITSVREAARRYKVPESSLRARNRGVKSRATVRANSHKLSEKEEETLCNWILALDDNGEEPQPDTVREAADSLLQARGTLPIQTVGEKWVYNFVKRHPELFHRFYPTSQASAPSSDPPPKTPSFEEQLRRHASSIEALLRMRCESPSDPSDSAINHLVKGCVLALEGAANLAKENSELRAAVEKQKQISAETGPSV